MKNNQATAEFLKKLSQSTGVAMGKTEKQTLEVKVTPETDEELQKLSDSISRMIRNVQKEQSRQKKETSGSGDIDPLSPSGSPFEAVFQSEETAEEADSFMAGAFAGDNAFVSNDRLARTQKKKGLIRVAAYIRVSTEEENQEESYHTQERYFTQLLAGHHGWISAGVYSDYGISATSDKKRTGFKRLMRHCKEGKIDRVVCKSISRFARNTADFMKSLNILKENHISIYFEKENLDTQDATSEFILTTLGAIAQEESRSISTNLLWGYQKRYPKGEARNILMYGYRYATGEEAYAVSEGGYRFRQLEVVEKEAVVVREIFQGVADGESYAELARQLNLKHIPAPDTARKRCMKKLEEGETLPNGMLKEELTQGWTSSIISRMLRMERYTGAVKLQKFYSPEMHISKRNQGEQPQYWVEDHHPAIISKELFDQVQKIIAMNQSQYEGRSKERTVYPFSHMLLCPQCGKFFFSRNRYANPIWICQTASENNHMNICNNEKVYEEQLLRMCRKAVAIRYELLVPPIIDDLGEHDKFAGRFVTASTVHYTDRAETFLSIMCRKLEEVLHDDFMERDRSLMKRQENALKTEQAQVQKKYQMLDARKETVISKVTLLNDESVTEADVQKIEKECVDFRRKSEQLAFELKELEEKKRKLEAYWTELEKTYVQRERALEWMESLPEGKEGLAQFMDGLTAEYAKAFILHIKVHSPYRYEVCWFDDEITEVQMDSNIEDFRNTASYYDRKKRQRSK